MPRRPDWSDDDLIVLYEEPTYVVGPDEAKFYMGAQVGWDTSREALPPVGLRCPTCGSEGYYAFLIPLWIDGTFGEGHWDVLIPGLIGHGDNTVCATCLSWGRDRGLSDRMLYEYAIRGTLEPIEIVPAWVAPYRAPFDPREIDPATGRPFVEAVTARSAPLAARFKLGNDGNLERVA